MMRDFPFLESHDQNPKFKNFDMPHCMKLKKISVKFVKNNAEYFDQLFIRVPSKHTYQQ